VQQSLEDTVAAVREAEGQIEANLRAEQELQVRDNRDVLNELWRRQTNPRARGVVTDAGANFAASETVSSLAFSADGAKLAAGGGDQFNRKWLLQNQLERRPDEQRAAGGRPAAGRELAELQVGKTPFQIQQQPAAPEVAQKEVQSQLRDLSREDQPADQKQRAAASDLERYRQRLESRKGIGAPSANRSQIVDRGMMGGMGGGRAGGDVGGVRAEQEPAAGHAKGEVLAGEQVQAVDGLAAAPHLASLDVQLPARGREYLFATPLGDVEITARAVNRSLCERLLGLTAVLAAAALLLMIGKAARGAARPAAPSAGG
jgi:hypothetical protein